MIHTLVYSETLQVVQQCVGDMETKWRTKKRSLEEHMDNDHDKLVNPSILLQDVKQS